MKNVLLKFSPVFLQNFLISLYNTWQYKVRHSGGYLKKYAYYKTLGFGKEKNIDDINNEVQEKLSAFLNFSTNNSAWYASYRNFTSLVDFPVLEKTDLINNLQSIATVTEEQGLASYTGGTTGSSMKVIYTKADMQERFAILDSFRALYGYKLGKKTAWFSGKNIVREQDISKGLVSRYDFINKIRFYSTFHINEANFESYWTSLCEFQPEFIVGFPSSVYEICALALDKGLTYQGSVKAFFPTAETVLPQHREVISKVLGCDMVDQYASSEGAPFILECSENRLHIHPYTGIFEVVDEQLEPAREGSMLVTSFTSHGTPLIRYRIGDRIKLAEKNAVCQCGSPFQLVEHIEGRSSDYVATKSNGKVNLGNLSNSTKSITGIICFQVEQNVIDSVLVRVVASDSFDKSQERKFRGALRERFGIDMTINIQRVESIDREKSGKFRIVKSSLC